MPDGLWKLCSESGQRKTASEHGVRSVFYLFVGQFYLLGILPGKIVIITAVKCQFSALKMKNPLADMI